MAEAEEEQKPQEAPQKEAPRRGVASILVITVIIITLFTVVIAYGVQSVIGSGAAKMDEGVVGSDGVREFRILAPQWYFEPSVITMNPGETVRFIVTSGDIMHGFAINELNVNLPLSPLVEVTTEVVVPPDIGEGTYTMYCSIFCGIGHPYMKGTIIIGEPGFEIGRILPYIATGIMAGMFATFIIIGRRR